MIELQGKHNTCKVFTDTADEATIHQIMLFLDQESMRGSQIRIMPDCHAGKGCVVGTTMTVKDKVIPNVVGVDIGCGMLSIKLKEKRIDLPKFDSIVYKCIPSGFDRHKVPVADFDLSEVIADVDRETALCSIGSTGGGNHFIELDRDENSDIWLVIHTGSRHFGLEVAKYYQNLGYKKLSGRDASSIALYKELKHTLIEKFKAEGREAELEDALKDLRHQLRIDEEIAIPYELAYVEGEDLQNYLHDVHIAQMYAKLNRQTIAKILLKEAKLHAEDEFDTIHNYIDIENMILRKGSISAQLGERVIIPMNMRDGSLICIGKGNSDWNYSAPHGAGRVMSRTEARHRVSMPEFRKSMEGIYSTSVAKDTKDEAPMVYKPMEEIVSNIQETVEIVSTIKPIYNFKAGGED